MNTYDPRPRPLSFTRTSDKESLCMSCFRTVQGDRYLPLEEAEDIHADVCLVKPPDPDSLS